MMSDAAAVDVLKFRQEECCDLVPSSREKCGQRTAFPEHVVRADQAALKSWFDDHYARLEKVVGNVPKHLAERMQKHRGTVERVRDGKIPINEKTFALLRQVFHSLAQDDAVGRNGRHFQCQRVDWPDPDDVHLFSFWGAMNTRSAAGIEEILTVKEVEERLSSFLELKARPTETVGDQETLARTVADEVLWRLQSFPKFLGECIKGAPPSTFDDQLLVHSRLVVAFVNVNTCLRDHFGDLL